MHVVINALAVAGNMSGIGHHTRNLIHGLAQVDRDHHYTLLVRPRRDRGKLVDSDRFAEYEVRASHAGWEQLQLPSLLDALDANVYHSTVLAAPVASPCAVVVTVHDVIPRLFPHLTPPELREYFQANVTASVACAARIIAVSKNTQRDLTQLYGVPEKKIKVVYQAASDHFRPLKPTQKVTALTTLARHGIRGRYVLFVGTVEQRKNVPGLLQAFASLPQGASPIQLVVAGGTHQVDFDLPGWIDALDLGRRVVLTGPLPDDAMPYLYGMAEAFVFPSLYEGFGLPVLEAMSCGVPVVTSHTSSLPEIAKDAALLINPYDPDDIARGLGRVLRDRNLRERMVKRGLRRAKQFSLEREAGMTIATYESALTDTSKAKTETDT